MSQEQPMSFAQALNEAKQYIVQQSNRIKTDADKIKNQQQTIVDQCATLSESERKGREQSERLVKVDAEIDAIKARLIEQTSAREQSEAVCDRQGERITNLQATVADLEAKLTEQSEIAATLKRERDEYRAQLPTKEDEDALAELTSLLTTKRIPTSLKANGSQTTLRISENRAEAA